MIYRISKSSYIRGIQCLKSIYLYKYFYKDRDPLPEERRQRFAAGHSIGHRAKTLFPGGIDLTPRHATQYVPMAKYTQHLVDAKQPVMYEPVFIYNEVLAALDILVYDDGWHAYEVKSSVEISDTYRNDAALQYYIITSCGVELKEFSIIHLKKHHKEVTGEESNEDLFTITPLKDYCMERMEYTSTQIELIRKTINGPGIPKIEMGDHCTRPYDCDFMGFCKRQKALIEAARFKTIDM